jgi:hypothetical protein
VASAVYAIRQQVPGVSQIVRIATFVTVGAMHMEVMAVNDMRCSAAAPNEGSSCSRTLVAVSNYFNGSSYDFLDPNVGPGVDVTMKLVQEFKTQGARTMTHLALSAQVILLAVANEKGDSVSLMTWDHESMRFDFVAEHVCAAPTFLVSWVGEYGDDGFGFIAAASNVGDTVILRVDSAANIRVVQSLLTGPANALSVFTGHLAKASWSGRERCLMVAVRALAGERQASSEIHCSQPSSDDFGAGEGRWIRHFIVDTKDSGAIELIDLEGFRFMLSGNGFGRDMEVKYPFCLGTCTCIS